jgi:hypothetical protein
MRAAVTNWNGRLAFVGEEAPETDAAGAATPKRLPVTFQAEPVWTKDGDANATVIVHPSSVVGGSTGNPIDAGNFYEQRDKSKYPADDSVIYAHEYGHLLGIPDEYSQNNQQMHLLLHQASPNAAANAAGAALDRVTVERMVLATMARPLYAQLRAAAPAVVSAFRGAQPAVTAKLSEALRQGVRDDAVTSALRTRLEQVSVERLHASVPAIAAFETTANFSARQRALDAIGDVLSGPALTTRVTDGYWRALLTPLGETVNVAGIGDVAINMSSGVYGLGQGTGPAAAPGGRLAATTVGPAATGRRLPPVAPPASLVGQLRAVPGTWTAAGSAMQSAITPEAVAGRMSVRLNAANIAALVEPLIPGLIRQPKVQQSRALYQKALQLVTNLSSTVSGEILGELLDTQLTPILQASVTALQGSVHAEVERIMNTPAGALAAAAPPDADLVAVVASMKARLDASKAATAASTSRDPIGAGQAAPDQDVTYSYQGLMGSNRTTALRVDQFQPMLTQFNTRFKKAREKDFKAETH